MKTNKAYKITITSALLAVVIILQFLIGSIRIGVVNFTFVLVPIVIGGIVAGKLVGTILGFSFGLITFIMGLTGLDAFTLFLINENPVMTAIICLGKGTLCGFVSALVFEILKNKNKYLAIFLSAVIAPIVNTGLFILGAMCMWSTISVLAGGTGVIYFLFIVCAGLNFLVELAINVVCAPALYSVYKAVRRK